MFQNKQKKYKQLEDSILIRLIKESKDQIAFGEIYMRYGHLVMGVSLNYLKDESESQDITSQIFEELQDKIIKHEIIHFKSWLFQVTKNECLMFLRKNKFLYISSDLLHNEELNTGESEKKEKQLLILENSISKLNEFQGICIKYFYLQDKSYLEIANLLKLDLKKVKSHIQNGKRNLQNILQQHEEFE